MPSRSLLALRTLSTRLRILSWWQRAQAPESFSTASTGGGRIGASGVFDLAQRNAVGKQDLVRPRSSVLVLNHWTAMTIVDDGNLIATAILLCAITQGHVTTHCEMAHVSIKDLHYYIHKAKTDFQVPSYPKRHFQLPGKKT